MVTQQGGSCWWRRGKALLVGEQQRGDVSAGGWQAAMASFTEEGGRYVSILGRTACRGANS